MKRQEATRYARWSAGVAIAIVLLVVGVYLHRHFSARVARQELPPPVPAAVRQQSAQFTYSKMIGPHALFTVRASRATEYKDQNRSLLEDVVITIHGRTGDRNDTVTARECSYLPKTELIRCKGTVQIDLRNVTTNGEATSVKMRLETRDISFNRKGEEVSTPNDVSLEFPGGKGRGTGLIYDIKTETVKLGRNVQLQIEGDGKGTDEPIAVLASSMEYERRPGVMRMAGPVKASQDGRVCESESLEIELGPDLRPRRALANGGVRFSHAARRRAPSLTAHRMEVDLGAAGDIERVIADGNVHAVQKTSLGRKEFLAQHAQLSLASHHGTTRPRALLATGNVQAEALQEGVSRRLTTEGLQLRFEPVPGHRSVRIASAETTAPGEILTNQPGETDRIQAGKICAVLNSVGRIIQLNGTSNIEASRQVGAGAPEETTAQNLTATFAGARDWTTIEESGEVNLRQGDRRAQADRMIAVRDTNEMSLNGHAVVGDTFSSTSAAHMKIDQTTGALHASGSVISTYLGSVNRQSLNFNREPMHVSADRLEASRTNDHVIYSGHARLWQGDSVIDADAIELWRNENKLEARGNVRGIFLETSGESHAPSGKETGGKSTPTRWQVRAPLLDYWGDAGRVELKGGVQVQSEAGIISSQTMELRLAPRAKTHQLEQATALGNFRIEQNGRVGSAERAVYTADDGKFVLSGGSPTLVDASGNTTTGRELTFFLASDTILVDSEKGSRTITKHRVEK
jgi:LPS export ABC transporter protein LptC